MFYQASVARCLAASAACLVLAFLVFLGEERDYIILRFRGSSHRPSDPGTRPNDAEDNAFLGVDIIPRSWASSHRPSDPCTRPNDVSWIGSTLVWNDPGCGGYVTGTGTNNRKVLVLGDSLSRRFAFTLAALLAGETREKELGEDLTVHSKIDNIHGMNISFGWAPCFGIAQKEILDSLNEFDQFVVSVGVHYAVGDCKDRDFYQELDAFEAATDVVREKVIVRTQPLSSRETVQDELRKYVNATLNRDTSLIVIDHYEITKDRAIGENRIIGDTPDHFGTPVRLALAQHFIKSVWGSGMGMSNSANSA